MFLDMGMEETALGADVQNLHGALRLYESVSNSSAVVCL